MKPEAGGGVEGRGESGGMSVRAGLCGSRMMWLVSLTEKTPGQDRMYWGCEGERSEKRKVREVKVNW